MTFPPRPRLARRGPFTPSPSIWKKGPRLPPRLPQEMRSLEVRGQPAASPVGAKQPNAGACIMPAPAGEEEKEAEPWKGRGKGQAFPVYVTTRPPRKGKDLESSLLLGGLQLASVCGSRPGDRIPGAGRDSFPGEMGIQLRGGGLGLCSWGLQRSGLGGRLQLASWEARHGSCCTPGFDSSHGCLWLWLMLVSAGRSEGQRATRAKTRR